MDGARFDRLTRRLARRASRRTALGAALSAGLAGLALDNAAAQESTPSPAATPASGTKPVFMFVQTARSGRGEVNPHAGTPTAAGTPSSTPVPGGGASFLLTLRDHSGETIYFSDRPARLFGAGPTATFLTGMDFSPANPPNAALVAEFPSGHGVVVLQLTDPVYDAQTGTLTYGAEVLQGYEGTNLAPVTQDQVAARLPAEFGSVALFIDDCPDLKYCYVSAGFSDKKVGPIPDGPYGQCWQGLFKGGCQPCHESRQYLGDICDSAYPECNEYCYAGR